MIVYAKIDGTESCECHRCFRDRIEPLLEADLKDIPIGQKRDAMRYATMMILCPICGNKRCPHASDHRMECAGGNDPGQNGSIYS